MSMAARLRQAREEAGFPTAAAAAREHGWSEATYRHHENGTRGYDNEQASAYAKYYGVSAAWLLGVSTEKEPDSIERTSHFLYAFDPFVGEEKDLEIEMERLVDSILVRVIDFAKLSSGGPSAIYNNRNKLVAFSKTVVESVAKSTFREVVACFSEGDDMSPTIMPGSLLLVDTGQTHPIHNGQIWLMTRAGKVLIRRLRFESEKVAIAFTDSAFDPTYEIPMDDPSFYIHGRVVWIGQSIG